MFLLVGTVMDKKGKILTPNPLENDSISGQSDFN